jgi:hypothetical protein
MMREFDLASFAAFCAVGGELMCDIEIAKKTAIHVMAQMIAAEAKRVLGHYDYAFMKAECGKTARSV